MVTIVDEFLAQHRHFRGLAPEERQHIGQMASWRQVERGEVLALEGNPCERVYWVMAGRVRALKTSPEGREQVVAELGPGEVFYLVPALDGANLPVTAQAATRGSVLSLTCEQVIALLQLYPSVALQILADFARRLRRQTELVEDLALRSVPARLARLLLEGIDSPQGYRLTQRELAARLGTVREVVARTLARFDERHWIRLGRGTIEILDQEALRRVVAHEEQV